MATKTSMTKKTTAKAQTVNGQIQDQTVKMVQEDSKKKREFNPNDGIICRSVTIGGLFMEGDKTGMLYRFVAYGDECEVEYRDLVAAVRAKSPFIFNPYMVIEDDDFIAEFPQLEKFYNEMYSKKDLKDILRQEDISNMVLQIQSLPKTVVDSLKTIAADMVAKRQIDSLNKIEALDNLFGTELNLASGLFDQ